MKWHQRQGRHPNIYFWRTHDQQEIDYLEEADGLLSAYEFKWKTKRKSLPVAFKKAYLHSKVEWIDQENFEQFIVEI